MKRKFGFNLPSLAIPSRAENNALRKALEGNFSYQSLPSTPLIDRPILSWSVLEELREACAAIVQGTGNAAKESKPTEAIASLSHRHRSMKEESKSQGLRPAPLQVESRPNRQSSKLEQGPNHANHDLRKPELTSRDVQQNPTNKATVQPGNTTQPRPFPLRKDSLSTKTSAQKSIRPLQSPEVAGPGGIERPQTAPVASSEASCATPLTSSTDLPPNHNSTALTSAVLTPATKRASDQCVRSAGVDQQAAIVRADKQAVEWMKQQRHQSGPDNAVPLQPPPSRSGKRGRSLTSEIREFVRSRSRSRDRPSSSHRDSDGTSTSSHGWRSWGLNRQSSKISLADTVATDLSSRGQKRGDSAKPGVIDLNRDLPPLPPLDTYYKDSIESSRISTSIPAGQRNEGPTPKYSKSVAESKTRSRHKSTVSNGTDVTSPLHPPSRKMSVADSKISSDFCLSPTTSTHPGSIDLMKAAALARSTDDLRQQRKESIKSPLSATASATALPIRKVSTPGSYSIIPPHRRAPSQPIMANKCASSSTVNLPARPATRDATSNDEVGRKMLPPNFSRKMDLELGSGAIEITALPAMPPRKKPSGLRRMLSSLGGGRKDNEQVMMKMNSKREKEFKTWMDKLEKEGVHAGVVIDGNSKDAAVVQY